jgi:hypothetical protein
LNEPSAAAKEAAARTSRSDFIGFFCFVSGSERTPPESQRTVWRIQQIFHAFESTNLKSNHQEVGC